MKAHVLMSRETGDLFEGHRVCLIDDAIELEGAKGWATILAGPDARGWVVYHPTAWGPFWIFFNAQGVEELFEDLGAL
jgi:hypothetical protein